MTCDEARHVNATVVPEIARRCAPNRIDHVLHELGRFRLSDKSTYVGQKELLARVDNLSFEESPSRPTRL